MVGFPRALFSGPVEPAARALIGATLLVDGVGGTVVETEAYAPDDAASHSFRGMTGRNAAMFGPPGHAYVYLCYGMHWCLNVVCGVEGHGSAVLIRALAPVQGVETMRERRGIEKLAILCNGPGRLCQALGVARSHDGIDLAAPPFSLVLAEREPDLLVGPRIGITRDVDRPWRFGLAGSPFLSRRF